ncbi:MAG: response regulator transcription factor [Lewinellaceae bacterium]|nr:response regulator transcription factor [Saprospiraceae bacterium]MCB9337703.1 response regulator transcription factor [Lewinellaceae bacterium]
MTILLCTAEDTLLTSLEYRFRKQGWRLLVANDARQSIEVIKKQAPELVIVDLQMPDYEGLDVIQYLKKEVDGWIPILVAADLADDRLLLESLRLGGNDFIIAPYKPDELVLRIRRLLMKQEVSC